MSEETSPEQLQDPVELTPEQKPKSEAERRAALPPAALRALEEAETRRRAETKQALAPTELGGRDGPDPARYGDWEKKGIAVDF